MASSLKRGKAIQMYGALAGHTINQGISTTREVPSGQFPCLASKVSNRNVWRYNLPRKTVTVHEDSGYSQSPPLPTTTADCDNDHLETEGGGRGGWKNSLEKGRGRRRATGRKNGARNSNQHHIACSPNVWNQSECRRCQTSEKTLPFQHIDKPLCHFCLLCLATCWLACQLPLFVATDKRSNMLSCIVYQSCPKADRCLRVALFSLFRAVVHTVWGPSPSHEKMWPRPTFLASGLCRASHLQWSTHPCCKFNILALNWITI